MVNPSSSIFAAVQLPPGHSHGHSHSDEESQGLMATGPTSTYAGNTPTAITEPQPPSTTTSADRDHYCSSRSRTPDHKRAVSQASCSPSVSPTRRTHHHRSMSRDTAKRSGHTNNNTGSRHSSRHHSPRNARRDISLSPSATTRQPLGAVSQKKREDLLVLHQKSCRLFQDDSDAGTGVGAPLTTATTSSPPGTSSNNPCTNTSGSYGHDNNPLWNSNTGIQVSSSRRHSEQLSQSEHQPLVDSNHNHDNREDLEPRRPVSAQDPVATRRSSERERDPDTVIDWMTPSTRKREYEKIDRQNRGLRGWWRRIAPRWCRSSEKRTPFYEERDGKANYEGSVRRFRMDLPDGSDEKAIRPTRSVTSVRSHLLPKKESSGRKKGRSRWLCFRNDG